MITINMPVVGQDIPTGIVLEWLKKEGDPIEKDEVIAAVQSEKADFDIESPASGILLKIVKMAGEEADVLTPIGYIGEAGEKFESEVKDDIKEEKLTNPIKAVANDAGNIPAHIGTKVVASPLARKVAKEAGLSLDKIHGTGPNGRIIKKNVLASLDESKTIPDPQYTVKSSSIGTKGPSFAEENVDKLEKYTRVRQIIADRMTQSVQNVPHFYLFADIRMDGVMVWRKAQNEKTGGKITFTDIIAKAVAQALREYPRFNAHANQSEILIKKRINIGIATASEDGLMVPVIADADQKDIVEISSQVREKTTLARSGKLDLNVKGTFTITSLGMFGIKEFLPIINPPETGILAIGKIEERVVAEDSKIAINHMMSVNLACDHRAVDGAYGAQFLQRLKEILEEADFRNSKW